MPNKNKKNSYLTWGIIIGFGIGSILGIIFNNIALGSAFGMLLGIVIGSLIDYARYSYGLPDHIKIRVTKILLITLVGVILILLVPMVIGFIM